MPRPVHGLMSDVCGPPHQFHKRENECDRPGSKVDRMAPIGIVEFSLFEYIVCRWTGRITFLLLNRIERHVPCLPFCHSCHCASVTAATCLYWTVTMAAPRLYHPFLLILAFSASSKPRTRTLAPRSSILDPLILDPPLPTPLLPPPFITVASIAEMPAGPPARPVRRSTSTTLEEGKTRTRLETRNQRPDTTLCTDPSRATRARRWLTYSAAHPCGRPRAVGFLAPRDPACAGRAGRVARCL